MITESTAVITTTRNAPVAPQIWQSQLAGMLHAEETECHQGGVSKQQRHRSLRTNFFVLDGCGEIG